MATTPSSAQVREAVCEIVVRGPAEKMKNNASGYTNVLADMFVQVEVTDVGRLRLSNTIWWSSVTPDDTLLPNAKVGDICFKGTILTTTSEIAYTEATIYIKKAAGWQAFTSS
jgi:hypothetical protein